jgi:DNA invertase Pin-like site-specific DNA recombinase
MSKRVIELLRVSTDAQDVQRQRADLARLAKRFGLETVRTLELVGVSGTATLSNADMQRLLEDLKLPGVDGVAVSALDRLFRPKRYAQFAILDHFADTGKMIWSAREGVVDPASDSGFDVGVGAGARAGAEWRELRRRTMQGKEELRREGKHVQGPAALPRGIAFSNGQWSYQEPDCSRVARMYPLLLAGHSFDDIAAAVGGGFTGRGVAWTMRNPIWGFGTRTYPADANREQPLTVKVIDKPLVPVEVWEAAQAELDRRKTRWRSRKRPARFLAAGLLVCEECGKPYYVRCAARKDIIRNADYYYCSSAHPKHGPKCGARSLQRIAADAALESLVSGTLCQAPVLRAILSATAERHPATEDFRGKAEKEITRLNAKRQRIVDMRADGDYARGVRQAAE